MAKKILWALFFVLISISSIAQEVKHDSSSDFFYPCDTNFEVWQRYTKESPSSGVERFCRNSGGRWIAVNVRGIRAFVPDSFLK